MGGVEKISEKQFDVFIANINRNILLNDMEKYVSTIKSNGGLLLSGFFSSDKEMLVEAAEKLKLKLTYSESKNDWTMLHLIKE